jgi:hypothetical protein
MNVLAASHPKSLLPKYLVILLLLGVSTPLAIGQQTQSQPNSTSQLQPVSLPHLYWHFLIHQSELDAFAAKLDAQRRGGDAIRNNLQRQLGFSNADYAPIRASSQRLATELKPIETELRSIEGPAWNPNQAATLIAERETYIDREINTLSTELSPQNKAALERFMTQFFAPKNISAVIAAASSGKAVQQ